MSDCPWLRDSKADPCRCSEQNSAQKKHHISPDNLLFCQRLLYDLLRNEMLPLRFFFWFMYSWHFEPPPYVALRLPFV